MLAEAISLDGGALLVALLIALAVLAAIAGVVVLGFVLAPRAARGSTAALAGWMAVLLAEGLVCLASVAAIFRTGLSLYLLVPPAIVAAQVLRFVDARRAG